MANPKPFGGSSLDNSPLTSDGANFPCKAPVGSKDFYNAQGLDNKMAIGETQTLSFKGSAAHGGGSCQLALTKDMAPTASSTWQVILSIEGGCPTHGQGGPDTYPFKIPDGIAAGKYVFAWTWISKLAGQPEYYMNCAPVTVTGGASKRSENITQRADFPNLFVANLASVNSCKVGPSVDPVYPEPGPNIEKLATTPQYGKPTGDNCFPKGGSSSGGSAGSGSAGASPSGSGSSGASATGGAGSFQQGAGSSASAPASAPSASVGADSGAGSAASAGAGAGAGSGSGSAPSASSASSVIATPIAAPTTLQTSAAAAAPSANGGATAGTAPSASSPTGSASGGNSSGGASGGSTAGALSGACTSEGMWNCLGGTSFQRCASGSWSPVTPMAGGTHCTPGQSQNLAITRRGIRGQRWI
ncbi:MAG: hypothetical protein MMC23_008257 [Stictis urceolatum]|nr:hypothetical protein [Stictis urceolata]